MRSMAAQPLEAPAKADQGTAKLDDMVLVVLHNDDTNSMEHVVDCLMMVFGMNTAVAVKVMYEAHERGSATVAVEPRETASLHRDQLRSFGLIATIEALE